MIKTNAKVRLAALSILAAAACATGGGSSGSAPTVNSRFKQADQKMSGDLGSSMEEMGRAAYKDALTHRSRADQAREAGALDQARAEYAAAGDGLASITEKYGVNEYQIPLYYSAAELYMQAQQHEKAARAAERAASDTYAAPITKAMAWHMAAQNWLWAANQATKAGQLEPIRLPTLEQRNGAPLNPRPAPGAWKSMVIATDNYLANLDADPDNKRPAAERRGVPAPTLALIAAQVQYAFDNMEEARRRFDFIVTHFGDDAAVLTDALPLYAQTYHVMGDDAGYEAALAKVSAQLDEQIKKTTDEKQKAALVKVKEAMSKAGAGAQFAQAQKLLDAGKTAEAAAAFQALADTGGGDAAGALHNAALAWDKAGEPAKAVAARQRILKEFPDAKVAPTNALLIASHTAKKGDHAAAAAAYQDFLQKWPENTNRCVAMQNVAAELDQARKPADAAENYLAFGKDPACTKTDPNFAAKALYRAGALFTDAKKPAKAKEAFTACVAVSGVTDVAAKSQVEDAKARLKGK